MKEKNRTIKKIYDCEPEEETAGAGSGADFINELCEGCKKFSYCIPLNCADCEFRTNCTYGYELF